VGVGNLFTTAVELCYEDRQTSAVSTTMEDLMHLFQKWQANCRDEILQQAETRLNEEPNRATNL